MLAPTRRVAVPQQSAGVHAAEPDDHTKPSRVLVSCGVLVVLRRQGVGAPRPVLLSQYLHTILTRRGSKVFLPFNAGSMTI